MAGRTRVSWREEGPSLTPLSGCFLGPTKKEASELWNQQTWFISQVYHLPAPWPQASDF